jgi:DNA-binding LacI/PurR family transcriptional regulator
MNYRKGIEKVVEYLHALGHTRMAFVGHHATLRPIDERRKAFLEAATRFSKTARAEMAAGPDRPEGGRQAARELLSMRPHPTAIICVNDFMAIGVLRELGEQGLRVPEDVSVTGYDNIRLSEFSSPALTTVHIPRDHIGHMIFECLVPDAKNLHPTGREILISPELVVRESTGPAPRN